MLIVMHCVLIEAQQREPTMISAVACLEQLSSKSCSVPSRPLLPDLRAAEMLLLRVTGGCVYFFRERV
jgi:hypothetical protein